MTARSLRTHSLKNLGQMARKRGVRGWQSMRKDQLVRALLKNAIKRSAVSKSGGKKSLSIGRTAPKRTPARSRGLLAPPQLIPARGWLSVWNKPNCDCCGPRSWRPIPPRVASRAKDRLVVMVRGPYWLHVYWELTPTGIVRAQAALGELWHTAKPILRLLTVSSPGSSTASERVARDIPIHGGVTNWYVDVLNPPQTYRMEIGYLATNGRFFSLARSNTVVTPSSPADEKLDNHWSEVVEDCDKIYAMSGGYSPEVNSSELQEVLEERLRRPVGSSIGNRYGTGARIPGHA